MSQAVFFASGGDKPGGAFRQAGHGRRDIIKIGRS